MQLPSLFRTTKKRQFNYKPLFYNPIRDDLRQRISEVEAEVKKSSAEEYKIGISRGSIRSQSKLKAKVKVRTNFRLAIITLVLLGLAWFLLFKN